MTDRNFFTVSPEALFRYGLVSYVELLVLSGNCLAEAVRKVSGQVHEDQRGRQRAVSRRTLYRWVAAYRRESLDGLEPKARDCVGASVVLHDNFINYLKAERDLDRDASVPELIRRARELGVIRCRQTVSRITVWRALRRLRLATSRRKGQKRDSRRHEYSERMQMSHSDFLHFRAGAPRLRRAACYMLDDATRYGLDVRVSAGTGEKPEVFLKLLFSVIELCGLMDACFTDRGPAYKADDTAAVMANLGVLHIKGQARYPAGHGKIERFNQSTRSRILRCFDGNPAVDPDPGALTLRLRHDLHEVYNNTPHEALGGDTPRQRWQASKRKLRPVPDRELRSKFIMRHARGVSNDHVVKFKGGLYEVPRGLAGEKVVLLKNILDGSLSLVHEDRLVCLAPVDPQANATSPRARHDKKKDTKTITKTASAISFERAYGTVLDADGGCQDKEDES